MLALCPFYESVRRRSVYRSSWEYLRRGCGLPAAGHTHLQQPQVPQTACSSSQASKCASIYAKPGRQNWGCTMSSQLSCKVEEAGTERCPWSAGVAARCNCVLAGVWARLLRAPVCACLWASAWGSEAPAACPPWLLAEACALLGAVAEGEEAGASCEAGAWLSMDLSRDFDQESCQLAPCGQPSPDLLIEAEDTALPCSSSCCAHPRVSPTCSAMCAECGVARLWAQRLCITCVRAFRAQACGASGAAG